MIVWINSPLIRIINYFKLNIAGITLWPIIHLEKNPGKETLNHEAIHMAQIYELLIIFFYIIYLANFFLLFLKKRNYDYAYENILFEKEAYLNEKNLVYLKTRKIFSWARRMR